MIAASFHKRQILIKLFLEINLKWSQYWFVVVSLFEKNNDKNIAKGTMDQPVDCFKQINN